MLLPLMLLLLLMTMIMVMVMAIAKQPSYLLYLQPFELLPKRPILPKPGFSSQCLARTLI